MSEQPILPTIGGGWTRSTVQVGQSLFTLTQPAEPDALLEWTVATAAQVGRNPYWGILWPAARDMAEWIVEHPLRLPGRRLCAALELGCGLGLVGMAALETGLSLTFSDHEPLAVQLAVHNAAQNGFLHARGLCLDWHTPSSDSTADRFDLILGCDLLYDTRDHAALLRTIRRHLQTPGRCLLGAPFRRQTPAFCSAAQRAGFAVREVATLKQPVQTQAVGDAAVRPRTQILELVRAE